MHGKKNIRRVQEQLQLFAGKLPAGQTVLWYWCSTCLRKSTYRGSTLEQEIHSKTGVVFLKRYSQFSWDFIWSGHGSQIKKYKLPTDPSWIFEIRHIPHLLPVLICLFPALIALTADRHRCISCWCQNPVLFLCRSHLLGKQIHS